MRAGDAVRLKDPMPNEDSEQEYKVVEDRDTRVLVIPRNGFETWVNRPTFVFEKEDLEIVAGEVTMGHLGDVDEAAFYGPSDADPGL